MPAAGLPREAEVDHGQDGRAPVRHHERLSVGRDQRPRSHAKSDVSEQCEEHTAILDVTRRARDPNSCRYARQGGQEDEPLDEAELQVAHPQIEETPIPWRMLPA